MGRETGTRYNHCSLLQHLSEATILFDDHNMPLVDFIIRWLSEVKNRGLLHPNWHRGTPKSVSWATIEKYANSIAGALRLVHYYTTKIPFGIELAADPQWKVFTEGLKYKAKSSKPHQDLPTKPDEVFEAIRRGMTSDEEIERKAAAVLMWSWLTAARIGDMTQVRIEDIRVNASTGSATVTFRRGKGVRQRADKQAYTLDILIGDPSSSEPIEKNWWSLAMESMRNSSNGWLWQCQSREERVKLGEAAAKLLNNAFTQRSIRRGAAQAMARAGISEETIMKFTGHSNVKSLRIYLDYGMAYVRGNAETRKASEALLPTRSGGTQHGRVHSTS